jgi:hypothetical protein
MDTPRPNRLIHETSPYLRQHAFNPVDWYPWGEEALAAARDQGKPILLSIGYSACHWCHVMERECFENPEIARLMNDAFINIKVDREERPDLDTVYMSYVQATSGHGGWPLTVFLSPDGLPFYGGTYFPPRDFPGRPGFPTVLRSVARFFHEQGHRIAESREQLRSFLDQTVAGSTSLRLDEGLLKAGFEQTLRMVDLRYGGFGSAPKFPGSMSLGLLLRGWHRFSSAGALEAVELSLTGMARGGIRDHLGGGFHRYSVDDRWLVPHFEKMLYDNALLVRTYLEAWQATGKPEYREVVESTLTYVQECLTSPEGGFYSSEDADSEGEEGKFYVWTRAEIESVLDSEDAPLFCDVYGVSEAGNWEGVNILCQRRSPEAAAAERDLPVETVRARLQHCRSVLKRVRGRRPRPALDTKILASWNGLMVAACAEAGFAFADRRWLELAAGGARYLWDRLWDGRLWRSRAGDRRLPAFLDDYAHVAEAFLVLFQVSGETVWFERAKTLVEQALDLFLDPERGDFFLTACDHEALLIRPREYFDNAVPCGNSTMAVNLLLLYMLTGEERYRERVSLLIGRVAAAMGRYPIGFGNWLRALGMLLGPVPTVVVSGRPSEREPLLDVLRREFLPDRLVVMGNGPSEVPVLRDRSVSDGAAAWVCWDSVCLAPVRSPDELRRCLRTPGAEPHRD